MFRFITLSLASLLVLFAGQATAQDPKMQPDETWVSVSGTVDAVSADEFVLDYGKDIITVEMDDGDRDADAYKLLEGDKVTVSGKIDNDFFEIRTIEAARVYVEKLNTTFYASALDEEDVDVDVSYPVIVSETVLKGVVTSVAEEEFTVDTGIRELTVEVDAMAYDPLDDEGYQKIEVGDVVSVAGRMDDDFFEDKELVADTIVTLAD
jgi:uncharacterized protein YdeI (BOF family)